LFLNILNETDIKDLNIYLDYLNIFNKLNTKIKIYRIGQIG